MVTYFRAKCVTYLERAEKLKEYMKVRFFFTAPFLTIIWDLVPAFHVNLPKRQFPQQNRLGDKIATWLGPYPYPNTSPRPCHLIFSFDTTFYNINFILNLLSFSTHPFKSKIDNIHLCFRRVPKRSQ